MAVKLKLTGVYMAVDGDALAKETAETLVNFFGGKAFFVPPAERTIYHAFACICSNYVVAFRVCSTTTHGTLVRG